MRGKLAGAVESRAEALGWVAKPRVGVGDQIGYLRLRVARTRQGVNAGVKDSYRELCLGS